MSLAMSNERGRGRARECHDGHFRVTHAVTKGKEGEAAERYHWEVDKEFYAHHMDVA